MARGKGHIGWFRTGNAKRCPRSERCICFPPARPFTQTHGTDRSEDRRGLCQTPDVRSIFSPLPGSNRQERTNEEVRNGVVMADEMCQPASSPGMGSRMGDRSLPTSAGPGAPSRETLQCSCSLPCSQTQRPGGESAATVPGGNGALMMHALPQFHCKDLDKRQEVRYITIRVMHALPQFLGIWRRGASSLE